MNLNIGCGLNNRTEGDIDIDVMASSNPDVCCDAAHLPFKDGTFDRVKAFHVLEHVDDIIGTMDECYRVLKDDGRMLVCVPKFPHEFAIADPTHKRYFLPLTFTYFTVPGRLTGLKHLWNVLGMKQNEWEVAVDLGKA